MHKSKQQRKEYSLERIAALRNKVRKAYTISKEGDELQTPRGKSGSYTDLKDDIFIKTNILISEGTLLKFFNDDINRNYRLATINAIEKYIDLVFASAETNIDKSKVSDSGIISREKIKKNDETFVNPFSEILKLQSWNAVTNTSTPQWADYLKIPFEKGIIKSIKCNISTTSEYYRVGFKLFRKNGKLFGDGSIQSMDNNFVIHYGKNFQSERLFITTYRNGIRKRPDEYIDIRPINNKLSLELFIDNEDFLHLSLNETEVYKMIINKETREQIYMLAWGDGIDYSLDIDNVEFVVDVE